MSTRFRFNKELNYKLAALEVFLPNQNAFAFVASQADHPLLVGAVVDWNLSNDPLLFIEEIHMNNTVAVICSKMQNSKQIFQ